MAVLAVDLAARERGEDVALRAVADVALLAVQDPRAVRLLDGARLDLVGVRAGVRLGQGEAGELSARAEVGQEALLLLIGAEEVDPLVADRLVDAEDDRERRVDLGEGLEDARVAGLGEALAAVLLVDVEAEQSRPRRARGSPRRRSSAPPRPCAWSSSSPISRAASIRPRTFSCSSGSALGQGKTISSWISPRNRRLRERGGVPRSDSGLGVLRRCRRGFHWRRPINQGVTRSAISARQRQRRRSRRARARCARGRALGLGDHEVVDERAVAPERLRAHPGRAGARRLARSAPGRSAAPRRRRARC